MEAWTRPLELPRLRPGTTASAVLAALTDLQNPVANIISGGAGGSLARVLDDYIRWVDRAETVFRQCFEGGDGVSELHTARYWHVRTVGSLSDATIRIEAQYQSTRIESYLAQLQHEVAAFSLAADEVALVLDTNVYLHYHQLERVDWSKCFPDRPVRIVLPMPVLDELDEKKYDRNQTVRKAAGQTIRWIREIRETAPPETGVPFGEHAVQFQILLDPPRHQRRPNMDDEIVGRAEHLNTITSGAVIMGAADYGVHTRASVAGLEVWWPPEELKRDQELAANGRG